MEVTANAKNIYIEEEQPWESIKLHIGDRPQNAVQLSRMYYGI